MNAPAHGKGGQSARILMRAALFLKQILRESAVFEGLLHLLNDSARKSGITSSNAYGYSLRMNY
jgi:hypothetical protein